MAERNFDMIYNDYSRLVYWAAYKVVSNCETAEDITQSVFEKVIRHMGKLSELNDAQLKGWLYKVSTNLALDTTRKSTRELLKDEPLGDDVADSDALPDIEVEDKLQRMAVRQAIDKLDDIYKEVVLLHYFSEMTVREISQNTGISEGTVKSRLVRARTLLAGLLGSEVVYDER
ncbi:MAG: sigma-70 family RNA polymerase sigma factor [Christensenellaceae bacterium]|nr:sigma-70 family RNA polymerase sigma factor [Christensenellaceae bacterium]